MYYHAGTQINAGTFRWSESTRRTAGAAEAEAKRIAKRHGGQPVVEYWDKQHGMYPGECGCVAGSYFVK